MATALLLKGGGIVGWIHVHHRGGWRGGRAGRVCRAVFVLIPFRAPVALRGVFSGGDSEHSWRRPSNLRFNPECILPQKDAKIRHFTPILSPRIADDPVLTLGVGIGPPSHNRYHMIDHHVIQFGVVDNPTLILRQWTGIDASRHRTAKKKNKGTHNTGQDQTS